ncbi:hypothetical protein ACHAQA_008071 [Verticillium albo-atrum]
MRFSSLAPSGILALAASVQAQQTTPYTDPDTSIAFQQYTHAGTGFAFGIALPETASADFIGQITAPISDGYASVSLGGGMVGQLLVVAWPEGDSVITSMRKASGYSNPDVVTGDFSIKTIASSITETSFIYTFLCEGCLSDSTQSFAPDAATPTLGFALSDTAVTDPSNPASALNYHGTGFGLWGVNAAAARSAEFATWAALASDESSIPEPTVPGNGTSPGTPANITTTISNTTYDYIVAGAGAAGIVAAQRLAEAGHSVLLIERGAPSYYSTGGKAIMDWNETTTQYDVPGMAYFLATAKDTSAYCTDTASQAGCGLGGSTIVNAMMYVKPRAADFDQNWPQGWQWADGLEAATERLFERSPGTTLASQDGQRYDDAAFSVVSQFLSGNGWNEVDALESPEEKHLAYTHPTWLIENGLRAGPVRDYLPLAQALPNFSLQTNVKVLRVIRNGSAVTGVEVELTPSTRQIINLKSGGAAILAAGALSTPRLLFNSGIGPKAQIETVASGSTNIELPPQTQWIPLPVGENMKDHPIFTVNFNTRAELATLPKDAWLAPDQETIDLFAKGSGLLSQSGQRLNFWTGVNGTDGITRYVQGTVNAPSDNTVSMKVYLTHGLTSVGALGINAAGATTITTQPSMNTDGDREAVLSFMNTLIDYASKSNSSLMLPANTTAESLTQTFRSGSHYIGTALMGEEDDGSSVVDTDTRVWGTDNLYIVDASIHPEVPTGNTQAPVMVVAEHAVEKILGVEPAKCKSKRATGIKERREARGRDAFRKRAFSQW